MKILKPSYEIIRLGEWEDMAKHIERCARICYKSEDKITETSYIRMLDMLIEKGHTAMVEHASFSVVFTVDRGVTHEDVRHRPASFAQESTRYCNYSNGKFGNEISVIDIRGGIALDTKMRSMSGTQIGEIVNEWMDAMEDAERHYLRMIELGATPQIARSVLPTSTKAEIVITANIREWLHILSLRTPSTAHPQMREIMIPLSKQLAKEAPFFFGEYADKE